jgi:xanthine dehydrogenase YagR molybdenum-binding subunit
MCAFRIALANIQSRFWSSIEMERSLASKTKSSSIPPRRVHEETGEVRVSRWLCSLDCGRVVNPKTGTSQIRGGIIMGIGMALMEETLFDERRGRIMNPSLSEYHVPVNLDVPDVEIAFLNIPDEHTPYGARGIGEIGITGVAAAIANAVYHATGKRVRELPITLDKLL